MQAEIRGTPVTLIVEAKSQGEPRYIRQAADQVREYLRQFPGAYPMVVSSFISAQTAELLKSRDIGYFDLAGNVLIDFGPVFINHSRKAESQPGSEDAENLVRCQEFAHLARAPDKSRKVLECSRSLS